MRWLMIALLVSLGALLLAAAGAARHILRQRGKLRGRSGAGDETSQGLSNPALDPVEEPDQEL